MSTSLVGSLPKLPVQRIELGLAVSGCLIHRLLGAVDYSSDVPVNDGFLVRSPALGDPRPAELLRSQADLVADILEGAHGRSSLPLPLTQPAKVIQTRLGRWRKIVIAALGDRAGITIERVYLFLGVASWTSAAPGRLRELCYPDSNCAQHAWNS
jgi:hypothetical protein